jgi:DNA-directed RNA polymerase subunit M/transcription elongation factor TFIIS
MERNNLKILFNVICGKHPKWQTLSKENQETIVKRMERSCYNVNIEECINEGIDRSFQSTDKKYTMRYSTICNRVLSNLDIDCVKSTYLLDMIILNLNDPNSGIDANNVAKLSSIELCPMASQKERDALFKRQTQKTELKVSRKHVCRKCGANESVILEFQGRAADEASNHSIKCIHCEHVWRT